MSEEFDKTTNPYKSAAPRRNPGLITRVVRAVVRRDPAMGPPVVQQATTQTGVVHPSADYSVQYAKFRIDNDRQSVYRDVDEMDGSSEEVSTAMDIISDNGTTSEDGVQVSFEIHSSDTRVQDVLDRAVATSNLPRKVREIFRNFVKYGDYFGEPVITGSRRGAELTDLRSLPPRSMYRNEDDRGNLLFGRPQYNKDGKPTNVQGECAFEQHEDGKDDVIATFWPWQIIHGRLDHDGFSMYGRSHFRVTRLAWRQLKALVEALVVGRLTRDLLKLIFYIDTTGLSRVDRQLAIKEFRDTMSNRSRLDMKRENPYSVMTDFYLSDGYTRVGGQPMPMRTKVELLDPKNAGQHNIDDIEFLHRRMLSTTRVPAAHMNFEKDSAPGLLTQQDVQYVRRLRSIQREVSVQVLEPFFNLALVLAGIDPTDAEYEVVWPALKATDEAAAAQTALAFAQADQLYLQESVLSPSYVQRHRFGMDDEDIQDVNDENDELAQREEDKLQRQAAITAPPGQGAAPGQQDSAHRDMDGKRKGDEGRARDGTRIPATKSKRSVNNPTGTGAKSTRSVKAAGNVDAGTKLLLEQLRHPRLSGLVRLERISTK